MQWNVRRRASLRRQIYGIWRCDSPGHDICALAEVGHYSISKTGIEYWIDAIVRIPSRIIRHSIITTLSFRILALPP